jgi:SAM-dependent methyltransferase
VTVRSRLRAAAERALGEQRTRELRRRVSGTPRVGQVDFGDLRRTTPISREFGFDRGEPVDRHYIDGFVAERARAGDVRGRVVEFGDTRYVDRLRADGHAIADAEVLDVFEHPGVTLVGDLNEPASLPEAAFDTVICTQVLLLVADLEAGVRGLHRMLRPGGVALVTMPGISQIVPDAPDHWRVTTVSAERLFRRAFGDDVDVRAHGNVLSAVSFLHGLASSELTRAELDAHDPAFELVVSVRARRAG